MRHLRELGFRNVRKRAWCTCAARTWSWACLFADYDHIAHSPGLRATGRAIVGGCGGSDHRIVTATFSLTTTAL